MSAHTDIMNLICTTLQSVESTVGKLVRYDQHFETQADFMTLHGLDTGSGLRVHSTRVNRMASGSAVQLSSGRNRSMMNVELLHRYEIILMLGWKNGTATAEEHQAAVDAVIQLFEADTFRDALRDLNCRHMPLDAQQIGLAQYGNPAFITVHQTVCRLDVYEY